MTLLSHPRQADVLIKVLKRYYYIELLIFSEMIYKKPFFPLIFFVILGIAISHFIALKFYLYWALPWFDIMMHFLGGFWFGFIFLWFLFFSKYVQVSKRDDLKYFIILALLSAFSVGVAWEIFEYLAGLSFVGGEGFFDTILDLIMDSVGGVVSAMILHRYYKKPTSIEIEEK